MRGKTNLAGGGMALNATTISKLVAGDNNIVAGDFVNYYTEKVIENTYGGSDATSGLRKQIEVGSYLFGTINGYMSAFYKNGSEITFLNYSSYRVGVDWTYYDGYFYTLNGGNYIYKYEFVNNAFKYVGYVEVPLPSAPGSYSYIYRCIEVINGRLLAIATEYGSDYGYCMVIEIDTLKKISQEKVMLGKWYGDIVKYVTGGELFVWAEGYRGGNCLSKITYGDTLETKYVSTSVGELTFVGDDGESLLAFNPDVRKFFMFGKSDLSENRLSFVLAKAIQEQCATTFIENNIFILSGLYLGDEYKYLIKYNPELKVLELISENIGTTDTDKHICTPYVFGKQVVEFIYGVNKYRVIKVNDNLDRVILGTEKTDLVTKYSGYTEPIGVAKESGTPGELIEVYIPSV